MSTTLRKRGQPAVATDELIAAFAEPTRLRLLSLLLAGEVCVCDLVAALALPQPKISRHLAVLRRARLVEARRDGLWSWYALAPATGPLHARLLECLPLCQAELTGLASCARRCASLRDRRKCC